MVTSIAIPKATLKTNTVEGLSGIPIQPITPAVIINGIIFGMREQSNILKERNKYNMQSAIRRKAKTMLDFNPLMIKALPVKKVTLVPVKVILYFDVSVPNNSFARAVI